MRKKYKIALITIIISLMGYWGIKEYTSELSHALPRDSDTEFQKGSKIKKQNLSSNQVESLYKLCKVWGYTKYHHPDIISGNINWDAELFRVMPNVLKAKSADEVNIAILDWLKNFPVNAETEILKEDSEQWIKLQEENGNKELDASWIQDADYLGTELSRYLCNVSELYISDRNNSYASFEEIGTVSFENEKIYPVSDGDMGMYLLGLFRFWNIYEYYSPNVEITTEDWDVVLKNSIPKIAKVDDYKSYAKTIAEVVAQTGDAHSVVIDQEKFLYYYYGKYFLPCDIKIIENQVIVTQVDRSEKKLLPGDVLLNVDGMSLEDRIKEQKKYHALPEENKMLNQLKPALLQSKGRKADVQILRGEERKTIQIDTLKYQYEYENPLPNAIMDSYDIGYIDPSSLEQGDLEKLMKEFENTDGLIVDLRFYPSTEITYLLNEYINPEQKRFAYISLPNQAIPGAFYNQEVMSGSGTLKALGNDVRTFEPYTKKVILLMDEGTQSQSEFAIMSLRQAPNTTVLGNPSTGADGNFTVENLPGNIMIPITGLGVYTPEGEQTQRCGLQPDVECNQTIKGILSGKDELIEKAIKLIRE